MQSSRRLSQREFRAITQKGKGEIFLFSQYIYRPVSTYVTRLYAALGLSANTATLHSLAAALIAAGALLRPSAITFLVAAAGLQVYFLLDHVDGELARLDFWSGRRRPTADGEYLDYWVHLHSINLTFGALGVGLAMRTGHVVWGAVGLIAANCLGNFPKLTMGRILWRVYHRSSAIQDHPDFPHTLAVVTDTEGVEILSGQLSMRQRLFHAARELLFYPGCLIVLSTTLSLDAVLGITTGRFSAVWSSSYLVVFALVGVASKIRRTILSSRQLRKLTEVRSPAEAPPVTADDLSRAQSPD